MANEFIKVVFDDRIKDFLGSAPGTGSILTLDGSPPQGFITIDSSDSLLANNDYAYYCVIDGADWEIGFGIIDVTGRTVSRDKIFRSTNGDAIVDFTGAGGTFILVNPASLITELNEFVLETTTTSSGTSDLAVHGVTDFSIREPQADEGYALEVKLVGRQTGGTTGNIGDMAYISRTILIDNTGGTVTEQYDSADLHELDGGLGTGAAVAATVDAANNRIRLIVTGILDRNIAWKAHVKVIKV